MTEKRLETPLEIIRNVLGAVVMIGALVGLCYLVALQMVENKRIEFENQMHAYIAKNGCKP